MIEPGQSRAVFLDLNGTLVVPLLAEDPRDYQPIAGAAEAVALLCGAGFVCPVVTVQSRIEKGIYSEADFRGWFHEFKTKFAETGAFMEGPYVCRHRYKTPCACKKPTGSLYRVAAAALNVDFDGSFVIGDTREDLEAAHLLGCRGVLVRSGWDVTPDVERLADHVAADVMAAARWIIQTTERPNMALHRPAADAIERGRR